MIANVMNGLTMRENISWFDKFSAIQLILIGFFLLGVTPLIRNPEYFEILINSNIPWRIFNFLLKISGFAEELPGRFFQTERDLSKSDETNNISPFEAITGF